MPNDIPSGALQSIFGATPPRSLDVSGESVRMKKDLDNKFAQLEDEYRKYNSNSIIVKNKAEESRIQALRGVLQALQQAGIDPNDPEQIRAFMDALAERNPDLLIMFENAMNILLGEEQPGEVPEKVQNIEGMQGMSEMPQESPEMQQMQQMPQQSLPE